MRISPLILLILTGCLISLHGEKTSTTPPTDQKDTSLHSPSPVLTKAKAFNPIIPGFHPDPSICRVGDDYYLANSSFEYFPGVPIFQSKDLIHWKAIGHALDRKDQLDLTRARCDGGIYAPTLRFHEGTFYMVTTLTSPVTGATNQRGDFIVTATNPAGPWSLPHWINQAKGIDPSLFFNDDGSVYMCGNAKPEKILNEKHRVIWIQKLNLKTWQLEGPQGILDSAHYFTSGKLGSVSNFEGPHLYKKGGIYYLLLSHGGTGKNHAVSIWRSSTPLGPWEENPSNPILTQRMEMKDRTPGITCTGHADLVQGTDGRWWMVFLGVRGEDGNSPMGRETFLEPVDWSGIWPIVNPSHSGRTDFTIDSPDSSNTNLVAGNFHTDFQDRLLSPEWSMIRTPNAPWWSFPKKGGGISLQLRPDEISGTNQPSFLGIRITEPNCRASTSLSINPVSPEECAGLAIERSSVACWTLVVENPGNSPQVSVYEGTNRLASHTIKPDAKTELRISMMFPKLDFSFKQGSEDWKTIATSEAPAIATAPPGHFTGAMIGLYASSRGKESDQRANFDYFEYVPVKSRP